MGRQSRSREGASERPRDLERQLRDFRERYPLDERAADFLEKLQPEVLSTVLAEFRPKREGESDYSALCTNFVRQVQSRIGRGGPGEKPKPSRSDRGGGQLGRSGGGRDRGDSSSRRDGSRHRKKRERAGSKSSDGSGSEGSGSSSESEEDSFGRKRHGKDNTTGQAIKDASSSCSDSDDGASKADGELAQIERSAAKEVKENLAKAEAEARDEERLQVAKAEDENAREVEETLIRERLHAEQSMRSQVSEFERKLRSEMQAKLESVLKTAEEAARARVQAVEVEAKEERLRRVREAEAESAKATQYVAKKDKGKRKEDEGDRAKRKEAAAVAAAVAKTATAKAKPAKDDKQGKGADSDRNNDGHDRVRRSSATRPLKREERRRKHRDGNASAEKSNRNVERSGRRPDRGQIQGKERHDGHRCAGNSRESYASYSDSPSREAGRSDRHARGEEARRTSVRLEGRRSGRSRTPVRRSGGGGPGGKLREELDDFRVRYPIDARAFDVVLQASEDAQRAVMLQFRPKREGESDYSALVASFVRSVQARQENMKLTANGRAASPSRRGEGDGSGALQDFRERYPMDDRAHSILERTAPAVLSSVLQDFKPRREGEDDYSALIMSFVRSVEARSGGKGGGKGKDKSGRFRRGREAGASPSLDRSARRRSGDRARSRSRSSG